MAICIDGNFVCLGGGCFCQTPTGVEFSGEAVANQFCNLGAYQGSVSGYTSGGVDTPAPGASAGSLYCNVIDKFPFASDGTATDVGNLTLAREHASGNSSREHGYTFGGQCFPSFTNRVDRFSFASDGNASSVGFSASPSVSGRTGFTTGQSSKINDRGYATGGLRQPTPSPTNLYVDSILRFPFSAAPFGTASSVGELGCASRSAHGASSLENGYHSGGSFFPPSPVDSDKIEKFPFSSDTPATDAAELNEGRQDGMGHSSETHGYVVGYVSPPINCGVISKFPFSADVPASDVANLCGNPTSFSRTEAAGQSSTTSGYVSGGSPAPNPTSNIEKFPFSTDSNSSCVGDLSVRRFSSVGQQI